MYKVAVRRINEWDGPAMLKIYEPYVQNTIAFDSVLPALPDYVNFIDKYTYGMGWLTCEIDNTPAGFCYITENADNPTDIFSPSVDIQLFVKEKFQHRGVGKALYSLMIDIMQYGNRREAFARILLPNDKAVSFHKALGFEVVRTDKESFKKFDKLHDVLIMRRTLSPYNSNAEKVTKPYLIENADYEAAREYAATLVRDI